MSVHNYTLYRCCDRYLCSLLNQVFLVPIFYCFYNCAVMAGAVDNLLLLTA